jgi:hypothetical protein
MRKAIVGTGDKLNAYSRCFSIMGRREPDLGTASLSRCSETALWNDVECCRIRENTRRKHDTRAWRYAWVTMHSREERSSGGLLRTFGIHSRLVSQEIIQSHSGCWGSVPLRADYQDRNVFNIFHSSCRKIFDLVFTTLPDQFPLKPFNKSKTKIEDLFVFEWTRL